MKKLNILLTGLVLMGLLTACGKWFIGPNPQNTVRNNYEVFYQTVKENYSFFEEKRVLWDSLDAVYRPQINDSLNNDAFYDILSEMLFVLQDGHVNLYVPNNRSRNADWYLNYPANFNSEFVHRKYWGKDYQSSGALLNTWLNDSIGYIYYGSFSSRFSKKNLDHVLNRFANAKGLIFDVRSNGGGSMNNAFRLAARFVPKRTFVGLIQYKDGPGPDDFSVPDSIFITPKVDYAERARNEAERKAKGKGKKEEEEEQEEDKNEPIGPGKWITADSTAMMLDKPVVVLINRHSYSATNFFAAFMTSAPNATLMGDRSGGGGGVPVSFELPNGWKFRISATRTYTPDGYDIEAGMEPDIYQSTGPEDELKGVDAIIERAKQFILDHPLNNEEEVKPDINQ